MRKSLGEKRKEISAEQVEEITRLYAEFREGEHVKIFPNEAFGYMRITVERPLRIRYEITGAGFDTLAGTKAFTAAAEKTGADISAMLEPLRTKLEGLQAETAKQLQKAVQPMFDQFEKTSAAMRKAIEDAFGVRDPDVEPTTDTKGQPVPDPELRDNENVPLPAIGVTWEADVTNRLDTVEYRTAINDYVTAEVHPYVPDAWVDHDKTKIGYEIPLTRHFYTYTPPRPLADIDAEIKQLETEIQMLLREVAE
jgi:type I restriction enzyme M protein